MIASKMRLTVPLGLFRKISSPGLQAPKTEFSRVGDNSRE